MLVQTLGSDSRIYGMVSILSANWKRYRDYTYTTDTGTVPLKPLHEGQLGSDMGVCRPNLPAEDVPQLRDGICSGQWGAESQSQNERT